MPAKSMKDKMFLANVEETIKLTDQGHYEIGLPLEDKGVTFPNKECKHKYEQHTWWENCLKTRHFTLIIRQPSMIRSRKATQKGYRRKSYMTSLEEHGTYHTMVYVTLRRTSSVWYTIVPRVIRASHWTKSSCKAQISQAVFMELLWDSEKEQIALMGDIEAMFHQVTIPRKDRDLLRFLWWQDSSIERPIEEYRMCVHPFGATSSPAIANFALKRTAETARSHYGHEVIDTMLHNFYVDNCLRSVPTEAEAIRLVKDLKDVCRTGGLRLTKWLSNNREVLKTIPQEDRVRNIRNLDLNRDPLPAERALGMRWKVESDTFGY